MKTEIFVGAVVCLLVLTTPIFTDDALEQERKILSQQEGYICAKELSASTKWIDMNAAIEGMNRYVQKKDPPFDLLNEADTGKYWQMRYRLYEADAKKNLSKACDFLEEIARKSDAVTLDRGKLIYEIVASGTGQKALESSCAPLLNYSFMTLEGEEVVRTDRDKPLRISLDDVIPGFAKGVIGMRKGEKRKLYIHRSLRTGKQDARLPMRFSLERWN